MRLVISMALIGLLMARLSLAGYHPQQPQMIGFEETEPEEMTMMKPIKGPLGPTLKPIQSKPFIDEVALKAGDTPFWKALNMILASYLSSAAKKRNVPNREVRTAPEDYMILRKIRSPSNGGGNWLRGLCAEAEDDGLCQKQALESFNTFYKKALGKRSSGGGIQTRGGDYWQRFLNPPFMYQ